MIDGVLYLIRDGDIVHEFEKGKLTTGAYKHMTSWAIQNYTDQPPEELWRQAENAWESLSLQNKTAIWSIVIAESQNSKDICDGLLATLNGYQGFSNVKQAFSQAIKDVRDIFKE